MKAQVHKLDINKLLNVASDLNNLETKTDNLNSGKAKTVCKSCGFEKIK